MKTLLTLLLLIVTSFSYSQTVTKIDKNGNYIAIKDTNKVSKPVINTGKTYTDTKGIKYPVYQSSRGSLYIIRVSKNTGKEYKQYLKL